MILSRHKPVTQLSCEDTRQPGRNEGGLPCVVPFLVTLLSICLPLAIAFPAAAQTDGFDDPFAGVEEREIRIEILLTTLSCKIHEQCPQRFIEI